MTQKNDQPDEIDLGTLFINIGKGIKSFYGFLAQLLNSITNGVIYVILYLFDRKIWLAGAILLGVILGAIKEKVSEPIFEGTMVVRPNFGSGNQLYKNVGFYQELIEQKDFESLSKELEISKDLASNLRSFEIEPIIHENRLLSRYDAYRLSLDSVTAIGYGFDTYKENLQPFDYEFHEIIVTSTNKLIFKEIEKQVITDVIQNEFFKNQQEIQNQILDRNDVQLNKSLNVIDSLRNVYTEVLLKEANKEVGNGTNINMGGQSHSNPELALFATEASINNELDAINRERVQGTEILNVVSSFPNTGYKSQSLVKKRIVLYPLILLGLTILAFLGLEINKWILKLARSRKG